MYLSYADAIKIETVEVTRTPSHSLAITADVENGKLRQQIVIPNLCNVDPVQHPDRKQRLKHKL